MGKKWYESKTVLFNILSGVVAVAIALQGPNVGLSDQVIGILNTVIAIVNIFLRMITIQPIERSLI